MIAPFSDLDARAVKTMTGELVSAVGGAGAAAKIMKRLNEKGELVDLSIGRVSGVCTVSDMARFISVPNMIRLEIQAGAPILSKWAGDRLVRDGSSQAGTVCVQDLCRLIRETSDVNSAVSDAIADGSVDSRDRAVIRQEVAELRRVLDSIEQKVAQP